MPKLSLAVVSILIAGGLCAMPHAGQQRASPHESVDETIDGADLTITYGRPYMRGRVIMGGLVPYGPVWCPGADEATTVTTTRPLRFGDLLVATGRYTLWMLPSAGEWQMIVNKQTGQWHTQYRSSEDLGRVHLEKRTLEKPLEQLTFSIERLRGRPGGAIRMRWETTDLVAPFTVVQ